MMGWIKVKKGGRRESQKDGSMRTYPNIVGFADGDLSIFLITRMGTVFLEGKLQR